MSDYIVDPPSSSCSEESASSGASLTSQVTYDGSNLANIPVSRGVNMNTAMSNVDSAFLDLRNQVYDAAKQASHANDRVGQVEGALESLDARNITDNNTYNCITTSGTKIADTLTAMETYLCAITSLTAEQSTLLALQPLFNKHTTKGFVFNETNDFDLSGVTGLSATIADGYVISDNGDMVNTTGEVKVFTASKDTYIYVDASTNTFTYKETAIGAGTPASTADEVILWKITTDGSNITSQTDLRERNHIDETLFRQGTDVSSFIPNDAITNALIDMSSALAYDSAHALTLDTQLAHKKYVDDSIAALSTSVWTNIGGGAGIYYTGSPVGIGTATPASGTALHVDGTFRLTSSSEGAGKYLQSNANGDATWQTITQTIVAQDEGTGLGSFTTLNFIGSGVAATDGGSGVLNVTITGAISSFNDLSDVSVAGVSGNETLRYNGSQWVASTTIENTGSYVKIGDSTTAAAKLHLYDSQGEVLFIAGSASTGSDILKIESTGDITASQKLIYTYTNGGASPLGAGKYLQSDGSGGATWETFTGVTSSAPAVNYLTRFDSLSNITISSIQNDGSTTGINTAPVGTSYLSIKANTTAISSMNMAASAAQTLSTPVDGDWWYDGTALNFYNGTATYDLLSAFGLTLQQVLNNGNTATITTNGSGDEYSLFVKSTTGASGGGGTAYGAQIEVNATAAGANNSIALNAMATTSGTADVSSLDGVKVIAKADGTGSVGTIRGIYVPSVGVGAGKTATNVYGMYMSSLLDDGTISTNRYAIYQAGENDPNYFAGLSTFNKMLTINSASDNKMRLGGSSTSGYIEYYNSSDSRRAYLGFTGATEFRINNEVGGLVRIDGSKIRLGSYDFDGTVVPTVSEDDYVLTYDHSSGLIGLEDPSTINKTLTIDSASDSKLKLKGATTSNFVEYFDSIGTRRAYVGFTAATEFRINNESGGLLRLDGGEIRLGYYDFDGTVVPTVNEDGHVLAYSDTSGKIELKDTSNALQWVKASVDYTDFTSGTTDSVSVYTLPAGYVLHGVKVKHSTAFGGGGIISYDLSVGLASDLDKYSSYFDVFQTVSDTTFQLSQVFDSQNHGAGTSILVTAFSFGATLNNATSGAADIWLLVSNAAN
jgi:hypothetical protein